MGFRLVPNLTTWTDLKRP